MHGSSSALKMELSRVSHFTILYRTLQPNCRTLSLDLARHGCHHRRQQDFQGWYLARGGLSALLLGETA